MREISQEEYSNLVASFGNANKDYARDSVLHKAFDFQIKSLFCHPATKDWSAMQIFEAADKMVKEVNNQGEKT